MSRPRIVVLDGATLNPGDLSWEGLAALGELRVYDRTAAEDVLERARGAEILLTNKTRLGRSVLDALAELRFVAVLATGYDVVDVSAARARGIPVSNVPEYGTESVAQHTFALLLELTNAVGEHARAVRDGEWGRSPDFCFWRQPIVELSGRTIGLVGLGRIGRRVGSLAHAFGMRVLAAGRSGRPRHEADVGYPVGWRDVPALFAEADVLSLHCPLTEENRRFVDASLLARMKPHAVLINTARGGLVDEPALRAALEAGRIAGAALDVVSAEPMPDDHPLRDCPRCIVTPHIAWASRAARARLLAAAVENVRSFLAGAPTCVVNG